MNSLTTLRSGVGRILPLLLMMAGAFAPCADAQQSPGPSADSFVSTEAASSAGSSSASPSQSEFTRRHVDIWSDGTRISGDFFAPAGVDADTRLPTLLLCHGWGGLRSHLNAAYAPRFAAAGFNVLAFDYRGWGDSDSRFVLKQDQPQPDPNGEATLKVEVIREVIDPVDQLEDIHAALDFLEGEPTVDMSRIGLWGTSYGGGHVIWTAAHDPRVACVVAQVGAMNSTLAIQTRFAEQGGLDYVHGLAVKRARGEIDPVPQGQPISSGLRGTPILEKVAEYRPVDDVGRITAPVLIIDVGKEELFDVSENGRKVYDLIKDRISAKYYIFPDITHYQIYSGEPYRQATQMAVDWFSEHLKP